MEYIIKRAELEDLKDINNILNERCNWIKEKGINQWSENYTKKYNEEYFKTQMQENYLYVAKESDDTVGVMLLKKEDPVYWKNDDGKGLYLHHLATKIGHTGLGKQMAHFAKEETLAHGKEWLRLDCSTDNQGLNDYYKKHGFSNVGNGHIEGYNFNLWQKHITEE